LCKNRRESSGKIQGNDVMGLIFATSVTSEGVVSIDVMFMMATGARGPVWVDREAQLVADAEEEC
jgi:hypothetical protein